MLCRGAIAVTVISWCLFATHDTLGNLLTFIGGGLFGILSVGAALVWLPLQAPLLLAVDKITVCMGDTALIANVAARLCVYAVSKRSDYVQRYCLHC